jgi:hypothetical protein
MSNPENADASNRKVSSSGASGSPSWWKDFVADPHPSADDQFLDDLSATRRFLSYSLKRGSQVPTDALDSMAQLISVFGEDVRTYEDRIRRGRWDSSKYWWWPGKIIKNAMED